MLKMINMDSMICMIYILYIIYIIIYILYVIIIYIYYMYHTIQYNTIQYNELNLMAQVLEKQIGRIFANFGGWKRLHWEVLSRTWPFHCPFQLRICGSHCMTASGPLALAAPSVTPNFFQGSPASTDLMASTCNCVSTRTHTHHTHTRRKGWLEGLRKGC